MTAVTPSRASDTQPIRKEAAAILANALARPDIAPQDRGYLTDLVTARTGLDRARAEARVNETVAAARQAAETARKALAHSMYWLFASLLLGVLRQPRRDRRRQAKRQRRHRRLSAGKRSLKMRSILLWLLGVPLSLVILIGLFSHF
jgi:hypothetical protein